MAFGDRPLGATHDPNFCPTCIPPVVERTFMPAELAEFSDWWSHDSPNKSHLCFPPVGAGLTVVKERLDQRRSVRDVYRILRNSSVSNRVSSPLNQATGSWRCASSRIRIQLVHLV